MLVLVRSLNCVRLSLEYERFVGLMSFSTKKRRPAEKGLLMQYIPLFLKVGTRSMMHGFPTKNFGGIFCSPPRANYTRAEFEIKHDRIPSFKLAVVKYTMGTEVPGSFARAERSMTFDCPIPTCAG